jgi:UDPglucose 6-dehydrogenase
MVAMPFLATDLVSAEMIKYASNAFLATKASFKNEMANLCELVEADVGEVAYGMGLDQRIGARSFSAGIGWGAQASQGHSRS